MTDRIKTQSKISLKTRLIFWLSQKKYKLSILKFNREKIVINFFIVTAFLSVIIGLTVLIGFLVKLSKSYSVIGNNVLLEQTGHVGDFIGGVVGAIWSLTGVLLFYATLRLQSKELAENRKHFQLSRLTDIIYKQIDFFNSQLSNFKLKDIEEDLTGNKIEYRSRSAISLLRRRTEGILKVGNDIADEKAKQKALLHFIAHNFVFLEINKIELQNIYEELNNQVNVVRSALIKEGIPSSDLNELKSLFFRNIGIDLMNASELLGYFLDWFIVYKKKQDEEVDLLFSPEHSIKRNISMIEEYWKLRYDSEIIKSHSKNRNLYETYP